MTSQLAIVLSLLMMGRASAPTLDVCEALSDLSNLSGKRVTVRGQWGIGDAGQGLEALKPCENHTVRDGWLFPDTIEVVFDKGVDARKLTEEYWRLRKVHPKWKIEASLSGALETREHFEVVKDAFGIKHPRAFGLFVARLSLRVADELEAVPYAPGEAEAELARAKGRYPIRVR